MSKFNYTRVFMPPITVLPGVELSVSRACFEYAVVTCFLDEMCRSNMPVRGRVLKRDFIPSLALGPSVDYASRLLTHQPPTSYTCTIHSR